MTKVSASIAAAARALLAAGWRPIDPAGRVDPPLGFQAAAAQWVSPECWQALVLMTLATDPAKVR
jgi:hypothetical protein